MTQHPSRQPRSRRRGIRFVFLATLALAASAFTGSALAAAGSGKVVLSLAANGDSSLPGNGIKVTYTAKAGKTGAAKRAAASHAGHDHGTGVKGKGRSSARVALRVAELDLAGDAGTLRTHGALALRSGKRTASLRDVVVEVGDGKVAIRAKLGAERLVVFRATGRLGVEGNSAKLRNAPLSLTGKGAAALRKRFGISLPTAGRTGKLSINAIVSSPSQTPAEKPAAPKEVPPPIDPYASQCPLAAVSEADGADTADPRTDLTGAPGVSTGTIGWGFKQSFRIYLATAAEGSATAVAPASVLSPPPGPPQVGTFEFPVEAGQFLTNAPYDGGDDQAVIDGEGEVVLCAFHKGEGFRVTLSNPTVTIDGDESRLTVDVSTNVDGTITSEERVDLATIDPVDAVVEYDEGPRAVIWSSMPTALTQEGIEAAKLGDFYSAGTALDPLTVEIVEPWPLSSSCELTSTSTTSSWPAAPAAPASLPTLSSPETVSEGSIDWGVRNGLRSQINGFGQFHLSGGATRSDAVSMAGAGKFFSWPATTGEYEDAGSDRLILHGAGTVGLCNTAHGYGTVLSNPTLVIDGANTRLSMDVASRVGASWTRFRVDLVSIATDDVQITTVDGPGVGEETITWTFPDLGADGAVGGADANADDTDSALYSSTQLTTPGSAGLWLLGASYRTLPVGMNKISVSIVHPEAP